MNTGLVYPENSILALRNKIPSKTLLWGERKIGKEKKNRTPGRKEFKVSVVSHHGIHTMKSEVTKMYKFE